MRQYIKPIHYSLSLMLRSPRQFLKELQTDIYKDYFLDKKDYKFKFVWCAGMPKSGTSIIESILNELPYVQINKSPIRFFNSDINNKNHNHAITNGMLKNISPKKLSFFKTHTHYDKKYLNIVTKYHPGIIVSLRKIENMMISRYVHILNEKNHRQYNKLIKKNTKDGFLFSIDDYFDENSNLTVLEYYLKWLFDWKNCAEKNDILYIYFENYINKPIEYINKILDYLHIKNMKAEDIENKLQNQRTENKLNLKKNLLNPGKMKSTYNPNSISNYKDFFKEFDLNSAFNSRLEKYKQKYNFHEI